jgi:poly(3-hydroxybutyrate) depolymerase
MLYQAYQLQSDISAPLRMLSQMTSTVLGQSAGDSGNAGVLHKLGAALDVCSRLRLTHSRPDYGISAVEVAQEAVPVVEEVVHSLPFGQLLHFKKSLGAALDNQPRVLLVAPLSGHFATLLRETVRTLLQDHDVFITDWRAAR